MISCLKAEAIGLKVLSNEHGLDLEKCGPIFSKLKQKGKKIKLWITSLCISANNHPTQATMLALLLLTERHGFGLSGGLPNNWYCYL